MHTPDLDSVTWRKSSYSGQGGDCIEIAPLTDGCHAVRDSKKPHGPTLAFPAGAWTTFIAEVKNRGFLLR